MNDELQRGDSSGPDTHSLGVDQHSRPSSTDEASTPIRRQLHRPLATGPLILANVIVFLAPPVLGLTSWGTLLPMTHPLGFEMGASIGGGKSLEQPWRLIAANFLHAGVVHLGCNMITLWSVGRWVESLLGPRRFLIVYTAAGIGAVTASTLGSDPSRLSLGASGAVLGVAWGVIVLLYRIRDALPPGVATRTIVVLSLLLALPLVLLPFFMPVDNWGHAGGSIVGALTMAVMPIGRRPRKIWSSVSSLPLVAFILLGVIVPVWRVADVNPGSARLAKEERVEAAHVLVRVGAGWIRSDGDDESTWISSSGARAVLEWDRVPRRASPNVAGAVQGYEAMLERECDRGRILDYEVFYREDRLGEGVGGIIAAYVLTHPGDGWRSLFSGRVGYRSIHVVRFFDGVYGPTRAIFQGPDSVYTRQLGLEFVGGIEPLR